MPVSPETKAECERVKTVAMSGNSEGVMSLRCWMCGGPLRIIFTPGERTALDITCPACFAAVRLDGKFAAPTWVATLGERITTCLAV